MKTRLLLLAIPCLLLGACNGTSEKDSANNKDAESAAMAHRDSLLKAANQNHAQDSAAASRAADTASSSKGKKGEVD